VAGFFYKEISEAFYAFSERARILFQGYSLTSESCAKYSVIWQPQVVFLPATAGISKAGTT